MAKLNVTGIEQTIKSLEQMGEHIGPVADAMLTVAGKLVAEGWQYSVIKHGHYRNHTLYKSIKPSKPKLVKGVKQVTVFPRGTDKIDRKTPVRNAEKGFVLNYGRRNLPASHWAEEATETTEEPAVEAMENVFDDWIWTGKLPDAKGDWADQIAYVSGGTAGTATFHQE